MIRRQAGLFFKEFRSFLVKALIQYMKEETSSHLEKALSHVEQFETEWAGRKLRIEVGKLAPQANASCIVAYGDTIILATAVAGKTPREGIDYFPLLVDYEERLYAAGKIKGSRFIKREGRPGDEAVVTTRLIDRSIRPLFSEDARFDVQVVITTLSWDGENDPSLVGLLGASCALAISDIPWNGPIAGVSLGRIDGKWIVNSTYEQMEKSELELFVTGTPEKVVMIEAGSKEVREEIIDEGIEFALHEIETPFHLIEKIVAKIGKQKFSLPGIVSEDTLWKEHVMKMVEEFVEKHSFRNLLGFERKEEFFQKIEEMRDNLKMLLLQDDSLNAGARSFGMKYFEMLFEKFSDLLVLKENQRVDGRKLDEVRAISLEIGTLPRTHGSGLFQRGETQVLSVVTLGAPGDQQIIDSMEEDSKKRFMHHYNFPGFSVGEISPMRSPGRREIGHGALAEKALVPVLPSEKDFPYTIRIVSEVLSSNGSSSQASVCGSSLALMDAGVPISSHVAGIAMGLILDEKTQEYQILTDIAGVEDHSGYMDCKVAGTRKGITAIQLDIKASGITLPIIKDALSGAKKAREEILTFMERAISEPRNELSPYAPRIVKMQIHPDKIREVIGPGGKIINEIIDTTGVEIDIEKDGTIYITAGARDDGERAIKWIQDITHEVTVGEIYDGEVVNILDFGAIVEFPPHHDGLLHISEISNERINRVEDVLHKGDKVRVKVISRENGRIGLSIKQADPNYKGSERLESPRRGAGGYGMRPHHARPPREGRPHRGGRGEREDRGYFRER